MIQKTAQVDVMEVAWEAVVIPVLVHVQGLVLAVHLVVLPAEVVARAHVEVPVQVQVLDLRVVHLVQAVVLVDAKMSAEINALIHVRQVARELVPLNVKVIVGEHVKRIVPVVAKMDVSRPVSPIA